MTVALLAALGFQTRPLAQEGELIVSAAASVADVMGELAARYRDEAGVAVRVSTGGSNTLARQIVEGAPVDVFLSADRAQMDVVDAAGRIVAGSRQDLLTNTLVIVTPESPSGGRRGQTQPAIDSAQDLALPGIRRIAMGNPDSVPAGVYGRRWLERAGVWHATSSKVIPFPTVRAALSAVQEGRADAGIVYATDAGVTTAVRVAVTASADEAPAVVYQAAAIRGAREPAAMRLLAWLRTEAPSHRFHRAGFGIPGARPSQVGMQPSPLSFDPDTLAIARFTALMAGLATIAALPLAIVTAWALARGRFPGRTLLETAVSLPLVLPPVATGLILLRLLGRRSPVGRAFDAIGVDIIFTWKAVVLAMAVMSFPLIVRAVRAGIEQVDVRYEQVAATLGARPLRIFVTITLPLAARGVAAGALLGFSRALGEFGATIMVAGSIPGRTRTLSVGIYDFVEAGREDRAIALLLVSLLLAFGAIFASNAISARGART